MNKMGFRPDFSLVKRKLQKALVEAEPTTETISHEVRVLKIGN
jgi:hypothetical protein